MLGCPTLAAFLFLRLGWDAANLLFNELGIKSEETRRNVEKMVFHVEKRIRNLLVIRL
jgi:hypothetical protein